MNRTLPRKIWVMLTAVVLLLCVLLVGCAATADAIVGKGGIVPNGYVKAETTGSSFYILPECTPTGENRYAFADGTLTVEHVDLGVSLKKYTESRLKETLEGEAGEFTLDRYQFYKLSGLLILSAEITRTNPVTKNANKEYRYIYEAGGSQIAVKILYNDADIALDSDFPNKLLYSIALND